MSDWTPIWCEACRFYHRPYESMCRKNERMTSTQPQQDPMDCHCAESHRLKIQLASLRQVAQGLREQVTKLEGENTELQALFDLQHTRTEEADKLWQLAHKEPLTKPDLGKLVEWLLLRGDKAILQVADLTAKLSVAREALEYYPDNCNHNPCDCLIARQALAQIGESK